MKIMPPDFPGFTNTNSEICKMIVERMKASLV